MRRFPSAAAAAPYAPAVFLVLAVAAGGLRTGAEWMAFASAFLVWTLLKPGYFSAAGMVLPLLFFSWLAVASLFSPEPLVSFSAFGKYALAGVLFYWAYCYKEGERAWRAAVCGIGAAAAAALVFQRLSGPELYGLIGKNPNYSAAFCAAAFAPALLELSGGGSRKEKWLNAALALLLAAGIAASGSRGAALAGFFAAAVGLVFTRRWRFFSGLIVLALAAAAFLPSSAWSDILKLSDPRAFARPRLWGAALHAAAASPMLGWGPGLFGGIFELFKFPYFDGVAYYGHSTLHAHSEVLNLAAEAGFPAAVLFVAAAVSALAGGWKKNLPLKLSALAVFIQGSADMVFYSGAVLLLFWGSLGFSAARACAQRGGRVKIILAALCLAALAAAPLSRLRGGREAYITFSGTEPLSSRNPALAVALARYSALAEPLNPFAVSGEGRALASAGDLEGAEAAFRKALALEPNYYDVRLDLAGLYVSAGLRQEACAELSVPGPGPQAAGMNAYQRRLMAHAPEAENIRKDLCRKKRTGSATAPRRRKP